MKAWFFLQDVEISDGPFNYCVGSNRLGWRRLKWEYAKSVKGKFNNDGYSEKGSFRAFDEDLKQLNLNSPKKILVKKNTLVIANTNGFHCRGDAEGGASRTSIFVSSRVNPFNIFPGINSITLSNIREKILIKYNIYKANQAKKINSRPPWHVVEGIKFTIKD